MEEVDRSIEEFECPIVLKPVAVRSAPVDAEFAALGNENWGGSELCFYASGEAEWAMVLL